MEKKVLVLEGENGSWGSFLRDYLNDVPAEVHSCDKIPQAPPAFDKLLPHLLFVDPGFLSLALLQKIKVRKQTEPSFRVYQIGEKSAGKQDIVFDGMFPASPAAADFAKRFVETLPRPETVRLLVVDDEEEIPAMVRDYFEGRKAPVFEIAHAPDGKSALLAIARQRPDAIILDIKMPVMDGREFYAQLKKQGLDIPVIVFFDSVSGEELSEIRKYGNPAVIEKGYQGSSLSAMMMLVKKMIYFGT
jgi:CheY-like chemotaxis protein